MAGEQKYTVDIGVTGLNNLNKLQSNIDGLHQRMMGLKTIIASGLFAGLGAGALRMADDLQDLANATGIATGRLLELKKALTENGGAADQMAQGVTTFVRSIDEAAQGSLKAQNTFRDLGITLNDLRTLSEQDLMVKTLKGLGNISDASRRASIQMDLFGKSFRTVDAGGLADSLEKSAGSADKYAASLRRAAELNDALATASSQVKLAFLEAFAPAVKALNEFNTATAEGTARMDLLIASIKIAGAALVTAFSVGIFLPLVTAIGTLGRGIGVVAGALGSAGIATWAASAFRALGPLMSGLRVIALLFSAGLGIYTASQLFDNFGSIALNVLSRITEGILELTGAFLNLPTDAIAGLMNLFGADIKDPKGLGTPFLMARDALEKLRKKQEETAAANKALQEQTKKTGEAAAEAGNKASRIVDTSAYDNAAKAVRKIGEEFKENGRRIQEQIELETIAIGKSKEANDLEAARTALANRTADAVKGLRDAQASMSKELKDAGLGKVYDEEIAKVQELARAEEARLANLVSNLAKAKAAEEFRLYNLKEQQSVEDKLLAIQRQIADIGLTDIEKGYRDIARAADDSAKAAIRAEEARRGAPLNEEEVKKYYETARKGTESLIKAQQQLNNQSRTFATGWKSAFKSYIDNATNAAKQAERLFEKFTSGIEDLLVNFAKTGKFEWKNFVADMAEELLRSQIKQTLASVLQMPNPFSSSGGSVSDLFGGMFGDLLGGSGASKGQSANNPMYVLDVGQGGGGGLFGGMMGPQQPQQQGGGIMGTIGNIFGGIKDTVGSVFGGIGDAIGGVVGSIGSIFGGGPSAPSTTSGGGFGGALGGIADTVGSIFGGGDSGGGFLDSITSSIGDFFGGFFANGGQLPAGKFGMVGERGPELIGGPATVMPMGGATNVTYNISAVDARSFQSLLASDPSFIFALTEQGRKSFAGAR